MNGYPMWFNHDGSVRFSSATEHSMNTTQFMAIKIHELVLSNICGGVKMEAFSDVVVIESKQPMTT